MDIKIMVVAHKPYRMPVGSCYLPLQVGAGASLPGFARDNTGENISHKNKNYCELTALYWAWKNLKADYIGLVHYRRHFVKGHPLTAAAKWRSVLTEADWQCLLRESPVVVPGKRRYYIETNWSHYAHAHFEKDLLATQEAVAELYPEALPSFQRVMGRTWAHMFNMLVMREDLFREYAAWLFAVLARVEQRTDISGYDPFQARLYGFLSEMLLDVWLDYRGIAYREVNVAFMEHINWFKKGGHFLQRKFLGRKKA